MDRDAATTRRCKMMWRHEPHEVYDSHEGVYYQCNGEWPIAEPDAARDRAEVRNWFMTRSHTTVETLKLQGATRSDALAAFYRGEGERTAQEVHTDWVWTGGCPITEEVGDGLD